jgi:hypothetical protein
VIYGGSDQMDSTCVCFYIEVEDERGKKGDQEVLTIYKILPVEFYRAFSTSF